MPTNHFPPGYWPKSRYWPQGWWGPEGAAPIYNVPEQGSHTAKPFRIEFLGERIEREDEELLLVLFGMTEQLW